MLEVRVFKFNSKNDVLGHMKPHFYLNWDFATLGELMADMQESDPYMSLEGVSYVKVNGVVCDMDAPLAVLVNKFHNELYITPLSEREATHDLSFKPSAFWQAFEPFKALCDEGDRAIYEALEPYFYASPVREFLPSFVGDSAIIFARKMCERYPEKEQEFLRVISGRNGAYAAIALDKFMLSGAEVAANALEWAKSKIARPSLTRSVPHFDEHEGDERRVNVSERFAEFDAVYYGKEHEISGLSLFEIASANLPSGFEFLGINDELAFGLASRILFEAFDSGADFLLVDNDEDFYMFDTLSRECEKHANRRIENFYVLRVSELMALDGDWEVPELAKHKLKVLI